MLLFGALVSNSLHFIVSIHICISKVKLSNCVCQMVSELPESVVETVILTQEESLSKNSGQKKKNRERGKVKPPGFFVMNVFATDKYACFFIVIDNLNVYLGPY